MKPQTRTRTHARGFSLLELSLVIAIMGVLMAVAAVNLLGGANAAKVQATKASMRLIKNALQTYHLSNNAYPTSLGVLIPSALQDGANLDAWDKQFYYSNAGKPGAPVEEGFTLLSTGPDMLPNTEDDIDIWIALARNAN